MVGGGVFLLFVTAASSVCTQFVASRLGYPTSLGKPVAGMLYGPFDWWRWLFKFYDHAPSTYHYAAIIFFSSVLFGLMFYVSWIGLKSRSPRKHEEVHGTAQFATLEQVRKTGLLPPDGKPGQGVYCGAFDDPKTGATHYLRHDGPEHIAALAPTQSGKGVGLVIPTLLSWPQSVFVLDIKGENYAMTSGWRKHHANNVVLRFDPAKPGSSCAWNPLSEIGHRTRFQVSDTQNIALMVVDSDGKGIEGNHFRSAAFELLVGLILHALYKAEKVGRTPCLQDIGHMLTGVGVFAAPGTKNDLADDSDGDPRALAGLFAEMREVKFKSQEPADGEAALVITSVGSRMLNTPARELGSIISTANNALSLYRDPIVGENTSRSDFRIADLMDHERPVSLYLISTPKTSKRLVPLTRLLLTMIVFTLADEMEFDDGRSKTAHKHRLLLMLDEFPTLGKLEVFEEALAYIAGYGMKAYLITQDVQQLYKAYTNYESIISNCHVRIAFAPNKVETAEWMSKMTGTTTVVKEQISTSGKRFGLVLEQVSRSYQEVQRPLMTPDEIMRLPGPKKDTSGRAITEPGEMLIFVAGQPVIRGRQILYFLDPTFSKRSKVKPVPTDSLRDGPPKDDAGKPAQGDSKPKSFVVS
ncbi:type IV secretory system conjugative DNA transfer family protein (plasmid) [Comamonas endophytica]|uniref:Type IV secretory system conjugative DNA transfer family protein n=2 Tax=Comamonas endophytica TaxID=2949090 RepID=A0ABY6GHV6_9BURK|nr:type IV secretory system conjugative DNA transfer family protein [Acidovorax sp. 5MLIR]UYG54062.1 type IV secretory system conjugative DNA transfer family protein [Acidovorax sp. 5MLIR]